MKEIGKEEIINAVENALKTACTKLSPYALGKITGALKTEESALGKAVLKDLVENAEVAEKESVPLCQDTGMVTVFARVGRDARLTCDLGDAVNEGVRSAYAKFYFRKSIADVITRKNTEDNTPAVMHVEFTDGDDLKLSLIPKGAGCENMSKLALLNPAEGIEGVKKFVINAVMEAGGRPCPPVYVGVGLGGNFESCALMAKKALLREKRSADAAVAALETELLTEINALGIGPMGLGGNNTCFDVFVETAPCHIASLPVAVCVQCHSNRHAEVVL